MDEVHPGSLELCNPAQPGRWCFDDVMRLWYCKSRLEKNSLEQIHWRRRRRGGKKKIKNFPDAMNASNTVLARNHYSANAHWTRTQLNWHRRTERKRRGVGVLGGVIERGETTVWPVRGKEERGVAELMEHSTFHQTGTGGAKERGSLSNHQQSRNKKNLDVSVIYTTFIPNSTSYKNKTCQNSLSQCIIAGFEEKDCKTGRSEV